MQQDIQHAESMHNAKHMLIAVDDSEASDRAVTYGGKIIGGRRDFRMCLLRALSALPQELLEPRKDEELRHAEPHRSSYKKGTALGCQVMSPVMVRRSTGATMTAMPQRPTQAGLVQGSHNVNVRFRGAIAIWPAKL